ncbi:MAG: hypothetical protein E6H91_05130 [Chloroflexi bacterium]|nr:MAG: hypothetical protein E6H91_05130 [Chloroflexota bacterium]
MAIAFAVLGAFLLWQALALRMVVLGGGPGPGLFPAVLGALLLGIGGRLALSTWRERPEFGDLRLVGALGLVLMAYATLLERLGFVLTTALAMAALMLAFDRRHRLALAALGIAGAVGAYALFYSGLKVQLPPDPWGIWQ